MKVKCLAKKIFKKKIIEKPQHPVSKEHRLDRKILLAAGAGAGVGVCLPVIFSRYFGAWWNSQLIPGWNSQLNTNKILIPLIGGSGLAVAGVMLYQRNEKLGALVGIAGIVLAIQGAWSLIETFLTPEIKLYQGGQRIYNRPVAGMSPVYRQGQDNMGRVITGRSMPGNAVRPMNVREDGRTISQYSPRPDRTSEQSMTKIKNYTIVS